MNITDFLPLLHRIYALSNVGMWICFILGIISLIAGLISISDYTKEKEASDVLGKGMFLTVKNVMNLIIFLCSNLLTILN